MKTSLPFLLAGSIGSLFWACIGDSRDTGPIRPEYYPTSIEGLESAAPTRTMEARDGDTVVLTATPVKKTLRGREVRMLAYNGSIPGPFWYHPHVRESYFLEMGLYGNFLVTPRDSAYWSPVNREVPIIFDDVLTDSAGIVKFRKDMADYAMMMFNYRVE